MLWFFHLGELPNLLETLLKLVQKIEAQCHKFKSDDFAESTNIAEKESQQEQKRKLMSHVSFVHWWEAYYFISTTARGMRE